MKSKTNTYQFVKYHTCLAYMFEPSEIVFIMRMLEVEFMKSNGYQIYWSRAEYMKRMGLKEYSFDKCIKRLSELKLLTKTNNSVGNRVYYSFDMQLYDKLLTILHSTRDIDMLVKFCKLNFNEKKRTVESITIEEIDKLRAYTKFKYIEKYKLKNK